MSMHEILAWTGTGLLVVILVAIAVIVVHSVVKALKRK